jgi:hypothetical protein
MAKFIKTQFVRTKHGSLFDRGSADSYYGRQPNPHWWPLGTGRGVMIVQLNKKEIAEYMAGFEENENLGHKKGFDSL